MNRSVRVSSMVDFVPSRAATTACTRVSGCSNKVLNSSSVLENAKVCFPVAGLFFIGGVTPNDTSKLANCGLLIKVSLSKAASNSALRAFSSVRCMSNISLSNCNTGSVNMRTVRSIRRSSIFGKPTLMCPNKSHVSFTSFLQ